MTEIQSENQPIFDEALKALQSSQFEEAFTLTKDLFALTPNDPLVLKYYGAACFLSRKTDDAQNCLKQTESLTTDVGLPILHFWAQILANYLVYDTAAFIYSLIVQNDPENWDARITLAKFLLNSKQFDKAMAELNIAKKNGADLPRVWEFDAEVHLTQGNKEEAQKSALKALEIQSLSYRAFHIVVDTSKADPKIIAPLNIEGFVQVAESNEAPANIRAQLNLTLGLLFEHQNDFEYAFKHYEIANNIFNGLYEHIGFTYNPKQIEQYNKILCDVLSTRVEQKITKNKGPRPIFILGMPRSGTTLAEQILSSHSKVEARGEINTLPNFANEIGSTAMLDGIEDAREKLASKLDDLRKDYLGDANKFPYIIDKTMTNFFHLGLIKDLFPDAIFIHVKRDKLATCFSNFVQPLSHYYVYSTSLKSINHFYKTYIEMMNFWKKNLDHDIYELDYQKLVQNPELEIKALIDHCGLEFEEACLHPEKAQNPVLTLSATALSEPINKNAINRWENFRAYLNDLT